MTLPTVSLPPVPTPSTRKRVRLPKLNRNRMGREIRREQILVAALQIARTKIYTQVTRTDVAVACDCSEATVNQYFGTMVQFQRAIMGAAIARGVHEVIAQGLILKDPRALALSDTKRRAAARSIIGGE